MLSRTLIPLMHTALVSSCIHKMSKPTNSPQEEFVKMNKGINDSKDLPREFLEKLYHAITTNEIKIKEQDVVAAASEKQSRASVSISARDRRMNEAADVAAKAGAWDEHKVPAKVVLRAKRRKLHTLLVQAMLLAVWNGLG